MIVAYFWASGKWSWLITSDLQSVCLANSNFILRSKTFICWFFYLFIFSFSNLYALVILDVKLQLMTLQHWAGNLSLGCNQGDIYLWQLTYRFRSQRMLAEFLPLLLTKSLTPVWLTRSHFGYIIALWADWCVRGGQDNGNNVPPSADLRIPLRVLKVFL